MSDRILYLRTEYDGRDLLSVLEIYYYDEDGEEVIDTLATAACDGLDTCADAGHQFLLDKVQANLVHAGISFSGLETEEEFVIDPDAF